MRLTAILISLVSIVVPQGSQRDAVRLESRLVQLNAVVTNRLGEFVPGLRKDEFELLEDGAPQEIAFFAEWSGRTNVSEPSRSTSRAGGAKSSEAFPAGFASPTSTFIIMIDDLHLDSTDIQRMRDPVIKLLSRTFRPGDRVAIVTTSGRNWPLAQLSGDFEGLASAIDRIGMLQSLQRPSFDKALTPFRAFLIDAEGEDSEVARLTRKELADEGNATAASMLWHLTQQVIQRSAVAADALLSQLLQTIDSLRSVPGQKTLVLVSPGFVERGSGFSSAHSIERMADAATRAGVVVHTVNARGLVSFVPGGDASERGTASGGAMVMLKSELISRELQTTQYPLNDIAELTGGIALKNNNDLAGLMTRAIDDSSRGYSLAFYPAEKQDSRKFRKLRLVVKGRPDLVVRTRTGYFPESERNISDVSDSPIPARALLDQLAPPADFELVSQTALLPGGDGRVAVRVSANLPGSALPFKSKPERRAISLQFVGALYSLDGKVVEGFDKTLKSELREESFERLIRAGITYRHTFEVARAGLYVSRIAVIDLESRRTGHASKWIDVPPSRSGKIVISGPLIVQPGGGNSWNRKDGFSTISDYWFQTAAPLQIVTFISNRSKSNGSALKISALLRPLSAPSESLVITNFGLLGNPALTAQGYTAVLPREVPPGAYSLQVFAESGKEKSVSRAVEFVLQIP